VATLAYSQQPVMPALEDIKAAVLGLKSHLAAKSDYALSTETYCRFLTGMSVPLFARNKVRQLPGFGLCAQNPYAQVRAVLEKLFQS
jgi:ATP-dependent DNA helicase RecQ